MSLLYRLTPFVWCYEHLQNKQTGATLSSFSDAEILENNVQQLFDVHATSDSLDGLRSKP
jgi:hypothetical protein